MPDTRPIIAIDARLVGGQQTGDSTYWTSLTSALREFDEFEYVLFTDKSDVPAHTFLAARSRRWWSLVTFPLAARRAGASVAHTQYTLSPLVKNGVTTIHDVSFLIGPQWFKARDRFLLARSVPSSVRRARRVITVSETSRREIERAIPGATGKVRVTPLACPDWIQRTATLRGDPYLLTVGTRWPRKNMELAVRAADLLPDSLPHKLLITGKAGWGSSELGKRGTATGYVSNEELSALYSAADLYLAPSRHEGFGIPVLEAFRCGCPVLCSTGGALPEVAGDAAAVEPSWSPEAWANRIQQLLGDRSTLELLRQRGLAREREFSWQRTAELTMEVYREVIG